jgi:hypothetical protein
VARFVRPFDGRTTRVAVAWNSSPSLSIFEDPK